jgi:hypothetical protein
MGGIPIPELARDIATPLTIRAGCPALSLSVRFAACFFSQTVSPTSDHPSQPAIGGKGFPRPARITQGQLLMWIWMLPPVMVSG